MSGVNRYLKDKAMDHIDHALGRPVDPLEETYRNYFYVVGDTDLRKYMTGSPHWQSDGKVTGGEYFSVTEAGKKALAAHLREIGDKHRKFIVSWRGYDMPTIAETASKAKYNKWLDVSDIDDSLTFAKFQKTAKVRLA